MAGPDKPYHHGNLSEALVAAAIALIEEGDVGDVSLRAVARRVGVSPAAPFRHFASKTALLTAVAEQAMERLRAAIENADAATGRDDPMASLEAIGNAYLRWAKDNPTHFQIISSRTLIDFASAPSLAASNAALRALMVDLVVKAQAKGQLPAHADVDRLVLSMRAFVYGLARMRGDGQMEEWHSGETPELAVQAALRQYLEMIRLRP